MLRSILTMPWSVSQMPSQLKVYLITSIYYPLTLKKLTSFPFYQMQIVYCDKGQVAGYFCTSRLKVQPSPKLVLALVHNEAQVWWLGLPLTPDGTPCPFCHHHNMDAWGHHITIWMLGDITLVHVILGVM